MAEPSFDALLQNALLEANWKEYRTLWETAEPPEYSPNHLRWRQRLLADPFALAKKQLRPLWVKVLRTAACLLLASAIALGALMAASPTIRASVLRWLREITGNEMTYYASQQEESDALSYHWRVTWLPEGWELERVSITSWSFQGPPDQGTATFACSAPGDSGLTTNLYDVSDAEAARETITVQGHNADYYESQQYRVLLWENDEGFLFLLRSSTALEKSVFLKIAESVSYYEGPDTAYQMSWVPEEYEPLYRDELIGAVQEAWTYLHTNLTWQYVTDPICSFVLPEGEPEEIAVGDLTARYWAAKESFQPSDSTSITLNGEPLEPDNSSVTVGGIIVTTSGSSEEDQTGTLVWEDPDTNTLFLLEGALDRQDLVRMAESVMETSPSPSPRS